jgi:apolipoprotein N-acyltransferase
LQATSAPTADGRAPDLTIWPETSLPELLDQSEFSRADIGRAAQGPVAVGALRRIDGTVHNSLALLDDQGAILAVYDKHHLVPFGEYLPFENMLNRMGLQALAANLPGGMRPGPGPVVMDLPNGLGRVFPMICYEAIFARYIAQTNRPDWMMHITNDAWFGDFSGPYQHLALSRLRAVEHGLPVLRAANTGISAVIDARGRVVDALGLGQAGFVDAPLPVAIAPTIYARLGDWPVLGLWVVLCVLVFLRPMQKPPLRRPA